MTMIPESSTKDGSNYTSKTRATTQAEELVDPFDGRIEFVPLALEPPSMGRFLGSLLVAGLCLLFLTLFVCLTTVMTEYNRFPGIDRPDLFHLIAYAILNIFLPAGVLVHWALHSAKGAVLVQALAIPVLGLWSVVLLLVDHWEPIDESGKSVRTLGLLGLASCLYHLLVVRYWIPTAAARTNTEASCERDISSGS